MRTVFLICTFLLCAKAYGQVDSTNNLEIDHLFIWSDDQSEIKNVFEEKGFITYTGKPHKGQGTIGTYVLVANMYIEFISVYDREEFNANNKKHKLKSMSIKPDWVQNNASPFGIGLHFTDNDTINNSFETFLYQQDWMNDSTYYLMSNSVQTNFLEPAIFVVPVHKKFNSQKFLPLLNHPNGITSVTSIEISTTNKEEWSKAITFLNKFDEFEMKQGKEELMKIVFDNFKAGITVDFRPQLPLIIMY